MPFITATELENWSNTRFAQAHLPTLVRRLVLATVAPDRLRFPAGEGVFTPGFDGVVDSPSGAPPYVPRGRSVWELGTGASGGGPAAKAKDDYLKRLRATPTELRAVTTFVFVTSRRWTGAEAWATEKSGCGDGWRRVVALDAEDLATWLALCPGVHGWLEAEALGRTPHAVEALGDWFARWSARTEPSIPTGLLIAGRADDATVLVGALAGPACERLVAASSQEEALAFTAAVLIDPGSKPGEEEPPDGSEEKEPDRSEDGHEVSWAARQAILERALLVHDAAAWRQWTAHESALVLLPDFPDPDIDAALRHGHHVVLTRAAQPGDKPIPRLRRDLARDAWQSVGVAYPRSDELAEVSCRSLTALLRRFGRTGRYRTPVWAVGPSANLLAPLMLLGAWREDVPGDLDAVGELADRSWRAVARDLVILAKGEDAPVLTHGQQWEFVDVRDAWDQLNGVLTAEDLDLFERMAVEILGETDPADGLTSDERRAMAFSVEGLPRRSRSAVLRRGLATSLAVLGSVGERQLAGGQTGQDRATRVVWKLLDGADRVRWLAVTDLLPLLAEASPTAFLDALESSISKADPAVMALFAEVEDPLRLGPTGRQSALLWALESLAFLPQLVSRVAVDLARLHVLDPGGRQANRPAESLAALLHPVRPQGAVGADSLLPTVDAVRRAAPSAGWSLMLAQVKELERGSLIRRGPRFRAWEEGARPATWSEVFEILDGLASRLAADAGDSPERWRDALGVLDKVPSKGREALLSAAEVALPGFDDAGKRTALSSLETRLVRQARFRDARWAVDDDTLARLEDFVERHRVPADVSIADAELFSWFPERSDVDMRTEEGRARLEDARGAAVARARESGLSGVQRLAEAAELPNVVGEILASQTTGLDEDILVLLSDAEGNCRRLAAGLVRVRQRDRSWLRSVVEHHPDVALEILLASDLDGGLVSLLSDVGAELRDRYWLAVAPWGVPAEMAVTVAEEMLEHDRPFSAMQVIHDSLDDALPAELTMQIMAAPAKGSAEVPNVMHSPQYVIGELLEALDRAGVDSEELARLEWFYLPFLDDDHVPAALHRRLAADPSLFVELVCAIYRQADSPDQAPEPVDATDGEGRPATEEGRATHSAQVVQAAWGLLHDWYLPLPGAADSGGLSVDEVRDWVAVARQMLGAAGRGDIAGLVIGEALCSPVADSDGTWPSVVVRDLLEAEQDQDLERGFGLRRRNQRGVTVRDAFEGGDQERALAREYTAWADAVRGSWPRAGALLDDLADGYEAEARREDERAAHER